MKPLFIPLKTEYFRAFESGVKKTEYYTGPNKMNQIKRDQLPAIGSPIAGGFFTGIIQSGDQQFAIITSPKSAEVVGKWGKYGEKIDSASVNDCQANSQAMAASESELAQQVLALEINGFSDWVIPSRDAVELQYRHFKPTDDENYCSFRDGDNPSSVPPGYLYTDESPAQTSIDVFKAGGEEAFEPAWYWTSTQYSANNAYSQDFEDGHQYSNDKYYERRVRPVRRLVIC